MGGVVDTIVDVFETVVTITLTATLIGPVLSLVSEDFKDWYLEELGEIMSWFGIDDEDVVSTQVLDQRLMDDQQVSNLITKIALDHQDTQRSIIDLMATYASKTRGTMNSYFDYGKGNYVYGLPEANIRAVTVPSATESVIESEYGANIVIDSAAVRVPTKEEYCYYKLNKLYGYLPYTNKMTYLGFEYTLKYIDYNYTTDQYDCGVYREATLQVNTIAEITVTITPYDATQDTKSTRTKITEESIHSIEGTTYVVVSDTTIDELVPKDSVVPSYSIDTVYGAVNNIEYSPHVISLAAFAPVVHVVVRWHLSTLDSSNWMSWVYALGSGNALLDNSNRYLAELDMLPIVELRNAKVNVISNTTTDLYIQSRDMLEIIGIDIHAITDSIMQNPNINDVEDAYIYFGLDVKDTSQIAAKMTYNSIEFYYYDKNLQTETGAYSIRVTEGKYNSTIVWRGQTRTIVDGIIGPVGFHQMTTSENTLIVRKQETPEQYVEYQLVDLGSTTFIKRGAFAGVVSKTLKNDSIIFPISFYMMNQLSPLEQTELFAKTLRLQTYALNVTHLEWYETSAFMDLIKIIVYVVAAVLFVLSLPAGGSGAKGWLIFAGKVLAMYAASIAFQKLLEDTKSPWLKALLVIAYVIAVAYAGNEFSFEGMEFISADTLTGAVTAFNMTVGSITQMKMEELSEKKTSFDLLFSERTRTIEERIDSMKNYIETEFISKLGMNDIEQYIKGPDMQVYRAIGMQYDWDILKGRTVYDNAFEYDKYYILGIV